MKVGKVYCCDIFAGTLTQDAEGFVFSFSDCSPRVLSRVEEAEVRRMLAVFPTKASEVEETIAESLLSDEAKARYLSLFKDRLRAIAQ